MKPLGLGDVLYLKHCERSCQRTFLGVNKSNSHKTSSTKYTWENLEALDCELEKINSFNLVLVLPALLSLAVTTRSIVILFSF